jgi:pSer/pThr/pTyr-binding forkhead associated (FHA) protein
MACLIVEQGEQQGRYYGLSGRPLVGGRAPAAEIQVVDPKVSRRHFLVGPKEKAFTIRELRSTNGVWVNDERIAGDRVLEDGDRIRVGDTVLVFRAQDDPEQSDAVREFRRVSVSLRDRGTVRG